MIPPDPSSRRTPGLPAGFSRRHVPSTRGRWFLWHGDPVAGPGPTLLCLHGRAEGAIAFARTTAIGPAAAAAGFCVAVPQARGLVADWDVDRDVDVVVDMFTGLPLAGGACVVVGMSQGARLAAALLVKRPDDFAGLVAVAGVPGPIPAEGRVHPRLYVHGDLDEVVPVELVVGHASAVAAATGCGPGVAGGRVAGLDGVVDSYQSPTVTVYPHPSGGDVALVRVPGGGHVWPGAAQPQPQRFGPATAWPTTAAVLAFARRCVDRASG